MSQLFSTVAGQGRPLVVLHGWGMNQAVWQPVRAQLEARARVSWLDLPGHGHSQSMRMGSLDEVVDQLADHIPEDAIVMGWSLGGLVAQALAQAYPNKVAGLVLVASTPRFVAGEAWAHGLAEQVLTGFASDLQQDYAATVKRFFALQFMGVRSDPASVHALRDAVMARPAALQALDDGLEILRTADFRQHVVQQPCLWLLGRLDKLIPVSVAAGLSELGYTQVNVLPKAAHVPFVTHPDEFMAAVGRFMDEC